MEYLRRFGLTPKLMHDPVRLEERAGRLIVELEEKLRVARLLFDRARILREGGGGTVLRVPSFWDKM